MVKHKYIRKHRSKFQVRMDGKTVSKSSLEDAISYRNRKLGYDPDPKFVIRKDPTQHEVKKWIVSHFAKHGRCDPVFNERVQNALHGKITWTEFDALKELLKSSYVPWSEEEIAEQKAHYHAVLEAMK